jgi:hypothetical protein
MKAAPESTAQFPVGLERQSRQLSGARPLARRGGLISPAVMGQIIVAGGGDGFRTVSAEQWVLNYLQVTQPPDAFQQAVTAMKTAAGSDSQNFWWWAYYWQYLPAFQGAPTGFGVVGSISTDVMGEIIYWGGRDELGSFCGTVDALYQLVICQVAAEA